MDSEITIFEHDIEAVLALTYPLQIDENSSEKQDRGTLPQFLKWLATPPMFTTLRVNITHTTLTAAKDSVEKELAQQCAERGIAPFEVKVHQCLPDCLVIHNSGPHPPAEQAEMEVIVDVPCGMAVMRGADVFKQGIMGAPPGMQAGSRVQVMADLDGQCLRGLTKPYLGKKLYVGTGIACVSREDLYCGNSHDTRGVGIQMTEPLYKAPSLSDVLPTIVFPQNLPSILCGHVLDPQPGQTVIDLCAAPGGKTCHIAALMNDKGRVIALDKTTDKIEKIQCNAEKFGLTCIEAYAFDSRNAVNKKAVSASEGPPYASQTFDAVLLDGPCSALGQRPAARNRMTVGSLASYPKLQRALLSSAVSLLRPGGVLVYSTCTVMVEENENQVAWALSTFPDLQLEPQKPHLGGKGLAGSSLSPDLCELVQRFDPSRLDSGERTCDSDAVGFFIAKFRKREL